VSYQFATEPPPAHNESRPATGTPRKAFVDGANLLLNLLENGKPSTLVFANVLDTLMKHDFDVVAIFDQSIRYHLRRCGCTAEWKKLQRLADASNGRVCFQVQADPHLLAMADACRKENAVVVNHTDRCKTWISQFPNGLPELVRVQYAAGLLSLVFEKSSHCPISVPIDRGLKVYGVSLSEDAANGADQGSARRTEKILASRDRTSRTLRARLIVFVLDASGSMFNDADGACKTFDGRRKSAHLTEVFKDSVSRLARSKSSPSFYTGLVSFAGRASVVDVSGARMIHISHLNSHVSAPGFDYVAHAKGNGTDLSAALDSAVALIDGVLASPDAKYIATRWSACIILITDALDSSETRVRETIARLGMTRAGLSSGQIDIGCVGIGSDVRESLLIDIASCPSPATRQMLTKQGLDSRLLCRSSGDPTLALKVSEKDASYPDVIRSFVDVVSQTTQS